jgi:pimeloyl-ACP methyl ester carboxylesterase
MWMVQEDGMGEGTSGTLRVPGSSLYYRVRGRGPTLLILPSGGGDADCADALADQLAERYMVVSYDRRGMARSALDEAASRPSLETHGEDAHRLLATLTDAPVVVFGCSTGAVIGLDLILRHPGCVSTFVAHEPPVLSLLEDAERVAAVRFHEQVQQVYRSTGLRAAMRMFVMAYDGGLTDREADVLVTRPSRRTIANTEFFLANDAEATARFAFGPAECDALKASPTRVVPAGGSSSHAAAAYRCAAALARLLATPLTIFPGGHEGYLTHPRGFATRLSQVLSEDEAG